MPLKSKLLITTDRGRDDYHQRNASDSPGEILREEFILPLGLSANALAIALRVPAPRINDIAREGRAISADTALRLARYFGTSAEFWLGLQSDYDRKIALAEDGARIKQDISPMGHAA